MNRYNQAFKQRTDKAALAIAYLVKHGCAITGMNITDAQTVITILPPPNNKVRGTQITINNTVEGRHYIMVTRLYGCTIKWKTHHNEEVCA